MALKCLLLVTFFFTCAGCSGKFSPIEPEDPKALYFSNKAKWQQSKSQISQYEISETQASWTDWDNSKVVVDVATDTAVSCINSHAGPRDSSPIVTDCLSTPLALLRVESYFARLEDLITRGNTRNLQFDSKSGAPIRAFGEDPSPHCADCLTPGFEITFKIR